MQVTQLIKKHRLWLLLIALVSLRLLHFSDAVDDPHAWRQYDTKQYIDGYYHGGDPFLEPSVCWMGARKTLILEFPLPEFLISKLFSVVGYQLWLARAFFLLFFAISAYYFYKSLRFIFTNWVPEIATCFYGLAPLALYYSRAIHIDYFALAFSFGMLYFCLKAISTKRLFFLLLSVLFATIAFVEKAPYCFYMSLPIIVYAYQQKELKWFLKRAVLYVIPVVCLILWNNYSRQTNELIPSWNYIPNFNKFTDMWYWYFGTMDQRLNPQNWLTILGRIEVEIVGYSGIFLLLLGIVFSPKNKAYYWSLVILLGTIIYAALFFNLNVNHNYYQLPFVSSLAILMAMGVQFILDRFKVPSLKGIIGILLVGFFAFESIDYAETNYYTVNEQFEKIAREIKLNSDPDDVVLVAFGGLTPQCPLILQPANRYGFSIPWLDVSPGLIQELARVGGVTKLAVVYDGYFTGEFQTYFEAQENKKGFAIDTLGKALYMCDVKYKSPSK